MSKTTITPEQILADNGEVLSRLLGEVLHPEETNHHGFALGCSRLHKYQCYKCSKTYDNFNAIRESTCTVADPIPLTWDNAMAWRDWAIEEFRIAGYMKAVRQSGIRQSGWTSLDGFMAYASKPKHYLQAAAIAKLNSEKGKP